MHDRIGDVSRGISKAPTGIPGLDELTDGGLPAGRPTLICGSAGCGKTLFSTTFLVKGAIDYNEPGVFMTFEERPEDIVKNVASLGYNLDKLIADKKIAMDYVRIERSEIEETGDYDLEGLFVRLNYAIDSIGAKRVVLDTIETLFGGLSNQAILRAELRRLFDWLRDKGVTAVITGERGSGALTRHGLEEYVSDCVILLDNRVNDQVSTRRLRIVKYRGSAHGTNEYPFLLDKHGISVMPITSVGLNHPASNERVPTGIPDLDQMMEGKGYYRGTSVLVSGMAGAGKSSVAAHFANSVCQRGEKCIYFAFEESPENIIRNMRSIGIDLKPWVDKGLLMFSAKRPSLFGMEMHLVSMNREVQEFKPAAVVVDPISALVRDDIGHQDVQLMLLRLIDLLKTQGITAVFTNLTHGNVEMAKTDVQVSSLMDTWLLLYNREANGEHNRQLYLLKSRGMAHSNQVREFLMTPQGIELREAYVGPEGVLTGSARAAQEAREKAARLMRQNEMEQRARDLMRKRAKIQAEITALQASVEADEEELRILAKEAQVREDQLTSDRTAMAAIRSVRRDEQN
jgi:circadian clock protein KaiC